MSSYIIKQGSYTSRVTPNLHLLTAGKDRISLTASFKFTESCRQATVAKTKKFISELTGIVYEAEVNQDGIGWRYDETAGKIFLYQLIYENGSRLAQKIGETDIDDPINVTVISELHRDDNFRDVTYLFNGNPVVTVNYVHIDSWPMSFNVRDPRFGNSETPAPADIEIEMLGPAVE